MKIVKVRIRRGDWRKGEDQMLYPDRYDAQEVDREGLGPTMLNGTGSYSGHIGKGNAEEWCFIALPDELADEYALDKDMEIIHDLDADEDMETWRVENNEPETVITDEAVVRLANEKKSRKATRVADGKAAVSEDELTPEETKALDPDDPTPGINKRLYPVKDIVERLGHTVTRPTQRRAAKG